MASNLVSDSEKLNSDPGSILAPAKKEEACGYQAEWSHLYLMAPSSKGGNLCLLQSVLC